MDTDSIQLVEQIVRIFAASLAPVTAIFVAVIAFHQYRLSHHKLKLDLFEKRYGVYRGAVEFIMQVLREGHPTMDAMREFRSNTEDAIFLFDQDINDYLEELWKKASIMLTTRAKLYPGGTNNGLPVGTERSAVCEEEHQLLCFFIAQHENNSCGKLFSKYLSFRALK